MRYLLFQGSREVAGPMKGSVISVQFERPFVSKSIAMRDVLPTMCPSITIYFWSTFYG